MKASPESSEWDRLSYRVKRARDLLSQAEQSEPYGPGYWASLAGSLEATLDLVCESAEALLAAR